MRIGILGGTFDPIHMGHVAIAGETVEYLGLDKVLFIPTGQPWAKKSRTISSGYHRFNMVDLAISDNPVFNCTPMEIDRSGPSYTIDTLQELLGTFGDSHELFLIMGGDSIEQFYRWKSPAMILDIANVVIANRLGYQDFNKESLHQIYNKSSKEIFHLKIDPIDISSTEIRRRISKGMSLGGDVHEDVERYIVENGLYTKEDNG